MYRYEFDECELKSIVELRNAMRRSARRKEILDKILTPIAKVTGFIASVAMILMLFAGDNGMEANVCLASGLVCILTGVLMCINHKDTFKYLMREDDED